MITLSIKRKLISLTDHEQGLATAAQSRSAMEPEFRAAGRLKSVAPWNGELAAERVGRWLAAGW